MAAAAGLVRALAVAGFASLASQSADAQDFPRTINLYVGYGAGGGYDTNARLVARFYGQTLPGTPNIVVQNIPGAGGLKAANWLYDLAPRDGSAIAITGAPLFLEPLLGSREAAFDAQKFSWIGSTASEPTSCAVWHTAGVDTFEDFITKPLLAGGSGRASVATIYPMAMNEVLGSKINVVQGYTGSNEALLAMERGEVQAFCGFSPFARPDWMAQRKVAIVAQIGLTKDRKFGDAPLAIDRARTDADRKVLEFIFAPQSIVRPYLAPPGIPPMRLAALRDGLERMVADPRYREESEKFGVDAIFTSGDDVAALLRTLYASPPDVVARAKKIMGR